MSLFGAVADHYVASGGGGGFSAAMLAKSPTGYWRLGEASGTTMTDSSGNGHSGTYSNVTLGQSSLLVSDTDKAASFNGSNSVGIVSYASWMDASTALSLYIVAKTSTGGIMELINRDSDSNRVYQFRMNSGALEFVTIGGTVGVVVAASPLASYADGAAHHFGATFDGSNIRLYVDGTKVKTQAAVGNLGTAAQTITIGYRSSSGSNSPFAGILDEAACWSGTVLSDADYAALYAAR